MYNWYCKLPFKTIFSTETPFCNKNFEINNGFIELDNREGLGVKIDTNLLMENTSTYKYSILDKN